MQSYNPEVTIRWAVFNDYREIYKLLGLIHFDFLLVILFLVFIYFATLTIPITVRGSYPVEACLLTLLAFGAPALLLAKQRLQTARACHWSNTLMAERENHLIAIACTQRKPTYSILAYLVVKCDYQRWGIGSQLVQSVVEQIPRPIFLLCDYSKIRFYERFGFERVQLDRDAPREFRNRVSGTVLVLR
jgi:N-acetylglutamate synthase-like GNAT family acetyltransferase